VRVRVRVIALFVLLACGLALPAVADQWSKSYPVTGKPDLWVSTGDGSVRIDVWDEARIEARIETVGYVINKDFQLIESQSGNQVKIEAKFPNTSWGLNLGQRSLTVTLKVPRESNLDIHTGDGSMTVNGAKGDFRFNTGDGSIEARGLDGKLTASTGDGGVNIEGRFDLLDLHTGDGAIEAAAKAGSTIAAAWSVRTGDGGVTLRVPTDFKANIDARTGDGGITVDLPLTVSGPVKRTHVVGTVNGGGGSLTLRTGDGAIRIGQY
jgi:DUF4097 and DUF4098 domain-containing protein YvlB